MISLQLPTINITVKKQQSVNVALPEHHPLVSNTETFDQTRLVRYLAHLQRHIPMQYHSTPNEGGNNARATAALKRIGLTPGVADLLIFFPHKLVALEMKRAQGTWADVRPTQRQWLEQITQYAYIDAWVACGYDAALYVVNKYVNEQMPKAM
jgi:hypothetical protein